MGPANPGSPPGDSRLPSGLVHTTPLGHVVVGTRNRTWWLLHSQGRHRPLVCHWVGNVGFPELKGVRMRKRGEGEDGAAAVEFGLLIIPFAAILFGLIQFGWYFWTAETTNSAAREVARRVVVGDCWVAGDRDAFADTHARGITSVGVSPAPSGLAGRRQDHDHDHGEHRSHRLHPRRPRHGHSFLRGTHGSRRRLLSRQLRVMNMARRTKDETGAYAIMFALAGRLPGGPGGLRRRHR